MAEATAVRGGAQANPWPAIRGDRRTASVGLVAGLQLRSRLVTRNRLLAVLGLVVGVALIVVRVIYWVEPALAPGFFPGHDSQSSTHHLKHGIAAFLVGLALLAFAWFQTGRPEDRA